MLSKEQENIIVETLMPYGPAFIGLFGSYARNEENENSDIDILYEFNNSKFSLFDLIDIKETLNIKLNKKIDLVSKTFLNKHLKPLIERDLITIYSA